MTMRRGHHTSSVLKAMAAAGAQPESLPEGESQILQAEEGAVVEPE
jgi:hypothetical protein